MAKRKITTPLSFLVDMFSMMVPGDMMAAAWSVFGRCRRERDRSHFYGICWFLFGANGLGSPTGHDGPNWAGRAALGVTNQIITKGETFDSVTFRKLKILFQRRVYLLEFG
jgi:hypothetical protein